MWLCCGKAEGEGKTGDTPAATDDKGKAPTRPNEVKGVKQENCKEDSGGTADQGDSESAALGHGRPHKPAPWEFSR